MNNVMVSKMMYVKEMNPLALKDFNEAKVNAHNSTHWWTGLYDDYQLFEKCICYLSPKLLKIVMYLLQKYHDLTICNEKYHNLQKYD